MTTQLLAWGVFFAVALSLTRSASSGPRAFLDRCLGRLATRERAFLGVLVVLLLSARVLAMAPLFWMNGMTEPQTMELLRVQASVFPIVWMVGFAALVGLVSRIHRRLRAGTAEAI